MSFCRAKEVISKKSFYLIEFTKENADIAISNIPINERTSKAIRKSEKFKVYLKNVNQLQIIYYANFKTGKFNVTPIEMYYYILNVLSHGIKIIKLL